MNLAAGLANGIAALDIEVTASAQQRMLDYLALVLKWNKAYNLTAVREPEKMLTHHLLDSLAVLPHLRGPRVLDVGTGAGLPGIPLALARPDLQFTLLDSNQKKTTFLRQAVIELKPGNVEVVCERVESWSAGRLFNTVVSRAFSELSDFIALAGRLCAKDGVVIAMKGVYPHDELAQLPQTFRLCSVVPLNIPGLGAERHVALLQPAEAA
ncbi:MAG: 16S rRNA (guanine(527)-N(7))-methyltransferase RsmG [Burkholderiales bacterium]|nr:16S rRNA (guanine(527)-N(7))-methyltransferase RsmG [Burkholderiales bacterium]